MKRNKFRFIIFFPVIILLAVTGCVKNTNEFIPQTRDFSTSSLVQVVIPMVNATRNFVYVNANPVTGSLMSSGGIFPSAAYAANVPSGVTAFLVRDTLTTSTQVPLSFAATLQSGKQYTIFVHDTISAPRQKTVQTDIVIPADSTCRLRFANFIYNTAATPAVDVFSFARNANIFTNVIVTDVSGFISYPSAVATDTLYIRDAGTTNNIIKFAITGGLTQKRSYTLLYRGSYRGTRTATLFTNW